jgi:hypothetical protein
LSPNSDAFGQHGARHAAGISLARAYLVGIGAVLGFGAYVLATTAAEVTSLVARLPAYAQQGQALDLVLVLILRVHLVANGASIAWWLKT